jgi:hypothetical protein
VPSTFSPEPTTTLCSPSQVQLDSLDASLGAGTSTLTFRARLVSGPACLVAASPSVALADGNGEVIARGVGSPDEGLRVLGPGQGLGYELAWTSWCAPAPKRPLRAQIQLAGIDPVGLTTPDTFEIGPCRDGPTGVRVSQVP